MQASLVVAGTLSFVALVTAAGWVLLERRKVGGGMEGDVWRMLMRAGEENHGRPHHSTM